MLDQMGDFHHWFQTALESFPRPLDYEMVEAFNYEPLPNPEEVDGIIITGSPVMLTDHEPWMEHLAQWTREAVAAEIPLLGVCFGHQVLGYAMGGRVTDNPNGREVGTVTVHFLPEASADPLFSALPVRFDVQATHVQSVVTLPPKATRIGYNGMDDHHAFAVGKVAWGVQFHPEFTADSLKYYIRERARILEEEGFDPIQLEEDTVDTPHGRVLLERFATIVYQRTLSGSANTDVSLSTQRS